VRSSGRRRDVGETTSVMKRFAGQELDLDAPVVPSGRTRRTGGDADHDAADPHGATAVVLVVVGPGTGQVDLAPWSITIGPDCLGCAGSCTWSAAGSRSRTRPPPVIPEVPSTLRFEDNMRGKVVKHAARSVTLLGPFSPIGVADVPAPRSPGRYHRLYALIASQCV